MTAPVSSTVLLAKEVIMPTVKLFHKINSSQTFINIIISIILEPSHKITNYYFEQSSIWSDIRCYDYTENNKQK